MGDAEVDCAIGVCGGSAMYDACGVCEGGNTCDEYGCPEGTLMIALVMVDVLQQAG